LSIQEPSGVASHSHPNGISGRKDAVKRRSFTLFRWAGPTCFKRHKASKKGSGTVQGVRREKRTRSDVLL